MRATRSQSSGLSKSHEAPLDPDASQRRQLGALQDAGVCPPLRRLLAARTPPPPTPALHREWPRPQTGR
eukprot:13762910-Alexandrium_andersonii.AAC.1